jgi:aspartate-semialdehyde dehydrogenase
VKKLYDVAIVGSTGLVGRKILELLEKRDFPISKLVLFASEKSAGKSLKFKGQDVPVLPLSGETAIKNRTDIALFSAGSEVSRKYAPLFAALGCRVIDNSSAFRMDENVPLVVPSINPSAVFTGDGIISNPNCSTIIALEALAPLHKKYGLIRVVYSTYQSVSGAGMNGIIDLEDGGKSKFVEPIQNNVLPLIGEILPSGYSEEEVKMIEETKKILNAHDLGVTATTVRVPVFFGHAISINVELKCSISVSDVIKTLENSGLIIENIPTPKKSEGKNEVFVGRIRRDFSHPNTFNMFVVSDNILKGAALHAVNIAELITKDE